MDSLLNPIRVPQEWVQSDIVVKNKKYEMVWKGGFPVYTGFDKTSFIQVKELELKGFLPESVFIDEPKALAYSPAHHNFMWEYIADLKYAKNLSAQEKDMLLSRYGRYLILRLRKQALHGIALREDGSVTDLGPFELLR